MSSYVVIRDRDNCDKCLACQGWVEYAGKILLYELPKP